jgi:hypothetical protein
MVPAFGDFRKKLTVALPSEIREINAIAFSRVSVTATALAEVNGLAPLDGSRVAVRRVGRDTRDGKRCGSGDCQKQLGFYWNICSSAQTHYLRMLEHL